MSSFCAFLLFMIAIGVASPTIDPNGGLFVNSVTVTLTCATEGADIRYTLDGSEPSHTSTLYTSPFQINETATVNAKAFEGGETSDIAVATFRRKQQLGRIAEANVRMEGRLGDRHVKNVDYLIALHDRTIPAASFDMLYPFLNRGAPVEHPWDGEYAGKWLDASALMVANTGNASLSDRVEPFAATLRSAQELDGYMGIDLEHGGNWDIWNMWYVLYGMLSHYESSGDVDSYLCAERTGDYIISSYLPPGAPYDIFGGAWGGGCTVDVLDQLMRLYGHSQNPGLLALGDHISGNFDAINVMRESGAVHLSHAYVVTAYLGGMVLYNERRANVEDLNWLETVWQDIVSNHLFHTHSIGQHERFKDPALYMPGVKKQETCATVEWLLWTNGIYEATGVIHYAHQIEHTVYNALLGAQAVDGMKWMYHTRMNGGTKSWFSGPTKCCYWSGPRGIARLPTYVYHTDDEGLRVDLYEAGTATDVNVNGTLVDITQVTSYPADGHVTLTLGVVAPTAFKLKLRLPEWAENMSVLVNGADADIPLVPGRYAVVDRTWHNGDQVELDMDMAVHLRSNPNMTGISGAAIQRGPEILAMDSRDNSEIDFGEVTFCSNPSLVGGDIINGRRRYASQVLVAGSPEIVLLTPFSDAGNDGATYRTVFPVAVCEADLDGNGIVGVGDLLVLFGLWGPCPGPPGCPGDFNGDGFVGVGDMLSMFANWGPCP